MLELSRPCFLDSFVLGEDVVLMLLLIICSKVFIFLSCLLACTLIMQIIKKC